MSAFKRLKGQEKRQRVEDAPGSDNEKASSSEELPIEEESEMSKAEENVAETIEKDPEDELRALADQDPESKEWKNRQRVLLISQRGIREPY